MLDDHAASIKRRYLRCDSPFLPQNHCPCALSPIGNADRLRIFLRNRLNEDNLINNYQADIIA